MFPIEACSAPISRLGHVLVATRLFQLELSMRRLAELILVLSFHHLELFLHTSHIIAKQNGWLRTSATSHIPREAASRVYALCSTRA